MATVLNVDGVVGEGLEVLGVCGFARRGEAVELVEDVLARVRYHPVSVELLSALGFMFKKEEVRTVSHSIAPP